APKRLEQGLVDAIGAQLHRLGGPADGGYVAVRSSAGDEDGHLSSSAGQHDTVLAVRGVDAVADAVARCWRSLHSARADAYRQRHPRAAGQAPAMAVLVQRLVDADVSGVLFTRTPRAIEAGRGLGSLLVGGQVTPDAWTLDDTGILARRQGSSRRRLDRRGTRLVSTPLLDEEQLCLDDPEVHALDQLGRAVSAVLGYEADVEWAIAGGGIQVLQARPITAPLAHPGGGLDLATSGGHGIPASPGRATGTVRVLRGPRDFPRLAPGDILVCRTTDPAWTPLFTQAAGIITETGGLLCHAAIVARELRIPAVLSVPHATTRFPDGTPITIDGSTGHLQQRAHTVPPP
ncbi:MAG: PEP/pyruvate-binding domain-containing protein, partial [Phycicoccus sp.]